MKLGPNEELLVLPDAAGAAQAGAEIVVQILSHKEGPKSVALAGGRTPAAMHRLLTQPPLRECVDWNAIDWFWGDERCVPPDHADSNYRMARETLLEPLGVATERIHRMPADAEDPGRATLDYEAAIRRHVGAGSDGVPAFDLILLGIGADGHTASLFPGSAGLHEHQRLVVAHRVPGLNAPRMTMTYPLLRTAKQVVFLACGADKAEALSLILNEPLSTASPPAAAVRAGRAHLTWILDSAAARLLPMRPGADLLR